MTTYLCTASITIEVDGDDLSDSEIEQEAKRRFFAEIETYKQDEVRIEVFEEIHEATECNCECGCTNPLYGGTCVDCSENGDHQNNNGLPEYGEDL